MPYIATINSAGYLPTDAPIAFDTPREAWQHLADERRNHESDEQIGDYSATLNILESLGTGFNVGTNSDYQNAGLDPDERTGTIYGPTPGYTGDHDIPLAYSVTYTSTTVDENRSPR